MQAGQLGECISLIIWPIGISISPGRPTWGGITNDICAWQSCGRDSTLRPYVATKQRDSELEKSKGSQILLPPYCLIGSQVFQQVERKGSGHIQSIPLQ